MTREEQLLARATGALRESGASTTDRAARTRARVVRRVVLRRASRQLALVLAALALVFVGVPGAWALATGRAPAWAEPILRALVSDALPERDADDGSVARQHARRSTRTSALRAPRVPAQMSAPSSSLALAPAADPSGTPALERRAALPSAVPPARAASALPAVRGGSPHVARARPDASRTHDSAGEPGAGPVQAAVDPDALYREAHALHFVARDPAAALAAWDRYLATAPGGRFALEARYNRALDLVRLGRADAARTALEPFARGELDGYRQQEAEALVAALDGSRAAP